MVFEERKPSGMRTLLMPVSGTEIEIAEPREGGMDEGTTCTCRGWDGGTTAPETISGMFLVSTEGASVQPTVLRSLPRPSIVSPGGTPVKKQELGRRPDMPARMKLSPAEVLLKEHDRRARANKKDLRQNRFREGEISKELEVIKDELSAIDMINTREQGSDGSEAKDTQDRGTIVDSTHRIIQYVIRPPSGFPSQSNSHSDHHPNTNITADDIFRVVKEVLKSVNEYARTVNSMRAGIIATAWKMPPLPQLAVAAIPNMEHEGGLLSEAVLATPNGSNSHGEFYR